LPERAGKSPVAAKLQLIFRAGRAVILSHPHLSKERTPVLLRRRRASHDPHAAAPSGARDAWAGL
jgi:hypothetical protein